MHSRKWEDLCGQQKRRQEASLTPLNGYCILTRSTDDYTTSD
jgi:hypothetical protein